MDYYPKTVAQALALTCGAHRRCVDMPLTHQYWIFRHAATIDSLVENFLLRGSGLDCGTRVDVDASGDELLVLTTSFHHMNDVGFYDGWTEHTIKVRASFSGLDIKIGGRDRNDIKDYLHDVFSSALGHELTRAEWYKVHGVADPDTVQS